MNAGEIKTLSGETVSEANAAPSCALDTGTLGKAITLLELVVTADAPLRFTDILAQSRQPRGSLHRQLSHLVSEGLLFQRPDLSYEPGLRLLKFAHRAWSRNDLRGVARPHLDRLHAETGETVHLGVLWGEEIIYIDKVESRQTVRMESQVGKASPLYCTGLGKAALSVLSPGRLAESLSRIRFQPFTEHTHRSARSLMEDLERIRLRGYAFDAEEHESEIRCIAAPVHNADFSLVGGVSVTGPAYRVSMEQMERWSGLVCAAAGAIAADVRLGPVGKPPAVAAN